MALRYLIIVYIFYFNMDAFNCNLTTFLLLLLSLFLVMVILYIEIYIFKSHFRYFNRILKLFLFFIIVVIILFCLGVAFIMPYTPASMTWFEICQYYQFKLLKWNVSYIQFMQFKIHEYILSSNLFCIIIKYSTAWLLAVI